MWTDFSERSKIQVDLELPPDLGRLPGELELLIFRVVQESLTNIHRHSGSSSAMIRLTRSERAVEFEISDQGKGIPQGRLGEMTVAKIGVGVRGMEERVRQFRGTLQITSSPAGTNVAAKIPFDVGWLVIPACAKAAKMAHAVWPNPLGRRMARGFADRGKFRDTTLVLATHQFWLRFG